MRKLLLFVPLSLVLTLGSGCSLFQKDKTKYAAVDAILKVAKPMSQKYLSCKTGDPFAKDLGKVLEKFFEVQERRYEYTAEEQKQLDGEIAQALEIRPVLEQICQRAVEASLPFLVSYVDGKLPPSWEADGCTSAHPFKGLKELALVLCQKI